MTITELPSLSCCCSEGPDLSPEEFEALIAAAPPPVPEEVLRHWGDEWSALRVGVAGFSDDGLFDYGYEPASPPTMAQLYAQLAALDARATQLELSRAGLLGRIVRAQADADLARDLPLDHEPSRAQRAAAVETAPGDGGGFGSCGLRGGGVDPGWDEPSSPPRPRRSARCYATPWTTVC